MPDFRNFQGHGLEYLAHSAKGTTWNNHKYIKKIWMGTRYYYVYPSMTRAFKGIGDTMTAFNEERKAKRADFFGRFDQVGKKIAEEKAARRKEFFGDVKVQMDKAIAEGKTHSAYKKSSGVEDVKRVEFTNKKMPVSPEAKGVRAETGKVLKQSPTNKLTDVNEQIVVTQQRPTNEAIFKGLPNTRKIYKKGTNRR